MKRVSAEVGKQDFPVTWFKYIHPSSKPRMTETSVSKLVHVAYSHIAYMHYQWTINLHDGYPLSKFCYQKSIYHRLFLTSVTSSQACFTLVMITFAPPKSYYYPLVTEVWHMSHFWVSYGRCTMPGSPMGRSEGSSRRWTG